MTDEHVDNFYETTAGGALNAECLTNGNCTQGLGYFFNNYLKTVKKNCANGDDKCVFTDNTTYKTVGGDNVNGLANQYCIQTVTGASVCGFYNNDNKCLSMVVDVNGLAQPNVVGRDIFSMDMHKNGSISDYNSGCVDNAKGCLANACTTGSGSTYNAACGCLNSVIDAGWKMEY